MENVPHLILDTEEAKEKNQYLANMLNRTIDKNADAIKELRKKLTISFWSIIILSIVIFVTGIALISVPVFSAYGNVDNSEAAIAGGFGLADLIGLVLYKPVERIHKLMGDMSQLILALNCNQIQTGLRLLEMNINDRKSIGIATEKICSATNSHIRYIQKYFENIEAEKIRKTDGEQVKV